MIEGSHVAAFPHVSADRRVPTDRLMLRSCDDCKSLSALDSGTCADCGGTALSRVPSCGVGSIVSCTVVASRSRCDAKVHTAPCTIAIVELDDGPWMYAWIEGRPPARSGAPVRVRFAHEEPGERYPYFVCAA
ncbi:Zn-ribbon domain-containing OB-fold protein [Rhodococcus gannanensis]|jgi:uncharacterized protein|uniref:Zn-ribbon domain-containing OB-fold protein n=1 Tax=Rhodococcus gannanensis TaxID=1960308 RepID=A0ABW4PD16_9NOCA